MMKLLIATTNKGKLKQIQYAFGYQKFECLSLADIDPVEAPEENGNSVEENALIKAKYYAEKSGLLTLSDDVGLFVDALDGWPGIQCTFVLPKGATDEEKRLELLRKMKDVPQGKRGAYFLQALVLYDPKSLETHISYGKTEGRILEQQIPEDKAQIDFGFNRIFFVDEANMSYAEMTEEENNTYSQRGKALQKMGYHLSNSYGERSMMVAIGIVIQDGKILMNRRNDPHNPKYHAKWEFPGGKVDVGELMKEAIVREVHEEAGFEVNAVEMIPYIYEVTRTVSYGSIKLYLSMFICEPKKPQPEHVVVTNPQEVLESRWFELESMHTEELVGENNEMLKIIEPFIKEFIAKK